jgi:hypothetical protein
LSVPGTAGFALWPNMNAGANTVARESSKIAFNLGINSTSVY